MVGISVAILNLRLLLILLIKSFTFNLVSLHKLLSLFITLWVSFLLQMRLLLRLHLSILLLCKALVWSARLLRIAALTNDFYPLASVNLPLLVARLLLLQGELLGITRQHLVIVQIINADID